jgi:twitching motility protein PilT
MQSSDVYSSLNQKILESVENKLQSEVPSQVDLPPNPVRSETKVENNELPNPTDEVQKSSTQTQLQPLRNGQKVQNPIDSTPIPNEIPQNIQKVLPVQEQANVSNIVDPAPINDLLQQDIYSKEQELINQLSKPDINPATPVQDPVNVSTAKVPSVKEIIKNSTPEQSISSLEQTIQDNTLDPENDLKNLSPKDIEGNDLDVSDYDHIDQLLEIVINRGASDLHLTVGYPPFIRIDDRLMPSGKQLDKDKISQFINQSLTSNHRELLEVNREVDLSYQFKDLGRFRINAYFERGNIAAAYRLIPQKIKSISDLQLPGILFDICGYSQGLFLVTGPTGSGKSTTLAAMIQYINESSPKHIITIEDPIEYVYPKAQALVDQRELGGDTHDWSIALKSALRQDPDVILIGEMRDFETIQSALTLAETGHLVFATLHTNSAAQSIDRIIDVFPPHQQTQVRTQLAGVLKGILSQRLVPLIGGGRRAVTETLIVTPAVQNLIREGKTYQIDNVISTGSDLGMSSLEKGLVKLVREGKITTSTAQEYAIRPQEILKLMKGGF